MRNMSFSLTTKQYRDGTKDVTRRLGWGFLKPGDVVMAVEKAMGLKKGEKLVKLGPFEVVSNTSQELWFMKDADCAREGFPELNVGQFVAMFCEHMKVEPSTLVNRIEFRRLPWDVEGKVKVYEDDGQVQ